VGAADVVTDATLVGPFDGQILDAATGEPIRDALVVGVWNYDAGDGFIGPAGSETVRVTTDDAGRYRIPAAPLRIRGANVRLVSFHLLVYRRGYVAYRSDAQVDGTPRTDFSVRHNRIAMRKWRDDDSHADHLMFMSAPRDIGMASAWERDAANLDLYRALGGDDSQAVEDPTAGIGDAADRPAGETQTPTPRGLLDATSLLPPTEVAKRTGDEGSLTVSQLPEDLERTAYYHGIALQATDRDATWDVTYRVWWRPPEGLDGVIETFGATLPGVGPSGEVTAETYLADSETVRVVGFVDREADAAVLLTCGVEQCPDMATAIILAKYVQSRFSTLGLVGDDGEPIEADAEVDERDESPIPSGAYPALEKPELGQ